VSKLLRHSGRHFIYTNDFVHFYFSALFGTRIFTNGGKKYITKRETKTTITNERRRRKIHFLSIPVGFRGSKKKKYMFPLHRHNCQQRRALYIKKKLKQNKHRKYVRAAQTKKLLYTLPKGPGFHLNGESRIRRSVSDDLINHQSFIHHHHLYPSFF
jgi:hypothetical protein